MTDLSALPTSLACAALPHWRVIRVSGADARPFLHNQLTQDIVGLTPGQVRLAGYCNAKGRLQASLWVWQGAADAPDHLCLLVHASLAEGLIKRLRLFVLRAKVTLELLDDAVFGLWSSTPSPALPAAGQSQTLSGEGWLLGAHGVAGAPARAWAVVPAGCAAPAATANATLWDLHQIQAGIPWITQSTFELFTPLMVNFDRIDAVSFTKGCYPGQEVVARSHYRGKQKRRTLLATAPLASDAPDLATYPGADVCSPGAREPLGRIVNAAQHEGTVWCLLEVALTDAEAHELRLLHVDGSKATLQPLPYIIAAEPT